jgi:DNA primase
MLSSPIEEIKNRLDILEVLGTYLKLQKAGANYRAVCPFHSEKKPSFFISPARQIWHCFGCNTGGDIFKFVMQIEGVEFGDALKILAQKAGVELQKYSSPEAAAWRTERQRLLEICELTGCFFEKQLAASAVGKEANAYLLKRGVKPESIQKWRLGYAPDVWQGLSDFLKSRGYQKQEIEKAGLGLTSEKGSFYDRFRGRIIFPVFDLNGQIIGFGGRVFKEKNKDDVAKYVNTPQTMLYDKSRTLYGLDKAKVAVRKSDACVLVEGYMDVIMAHQAGTENVVASSGTALTWQQLQIIKRYSNNLLTAFDMDVAGDSATKRGVELAQQQGFNVKVVVITEGKDPADIVVLSPELWQQKVNEAKSITEFYFETTFGHFPADTPEGKRNISKILLPVIKRIPSLIEAAHWQQVLARKLGVKEEVVEEELKKLKEEKNVIMSEGALPPAAQAPAISRKQLLEERTASLVLYQPQSTLELITEDYLPYFDTKFQAIFTNLREQKPSQSDDFVNYLSLRGEVEGENIDCRAEVQLSLREIEKIETKNKLDNISQEIKKAEIERELERVNNLTREFNKLANKLLD